MTRQSPTKLTRRELLKGGTMLLAAAAIEPLGSATALAQTSAPASGPVNAPARLGLITDLHYADKPAAGERQYRESMAKLAEAGERFKREGIAEAVCLGDLIDSGPDLAVERGYLAAINRQFSDLVPHRHYVLGNHCVEALTKAEYLEEVGQAKSYHSFDRNGVHFVALDGCFRADGTPYGRKNAAWNDAFLPPEQLAWLRNDLSGTAFKTVIFIHQRVDFDGNPHNITNAPAVRDVLEQSGKVVAVFQGHHHLNDVRTIKGITYCTLEAMVDGAGPESNAYAILEVSAAGAVRVQGFRKQESHHWPAPSEAPQK